MDRHVSRHAAFAAIYDITHPGLRPLGHLSSAEAIVLTEMVAACRAWIRCPPNNRPSAHALGLRVAEIASSIGGEQ